MRCACVALLLAILAPLAQAADADTQPPAWAWTAPELKQIALYQKKVRQQGDAFVLHTARWDVRSTVSAPFT